MKLIIVALYKSKPKYRENYYEQRRQQTQRNEES